MKSTFLRSLDCLLLVIFAALCVGFTLGVCLSAVVS